MGSEQAPQLSQDVFFSHGRVSKYKFYGMGSE